MKPITDIEEAFLGRTCACITRFGTESWRFEFERETTLDVRCPWRIIAKGGVALGYADHGQQFGLPRPIDGVDEAKRLLSGTIVRVSITDLTADIRLQFSDDAVLDVFNSSSGYEGWECTSNNGVLAIAVGGGKLQIYLTNPPMR